MYDRGVVELASIKHRLLTILPLSSLLSASTLLLYFAYRLKTLVLTDKIVNDPLAVLNSSLYFVTELGLFFPNFLNHLLRGLSISSKPKVPHLRLIGQQDLPHVDIIITCAGEDIETVRHTAEAACAIEYPSDQFRVIVSDDAKSDQLAASMRDLAKTNGNLYYTARVKGKVHHFKAGNLNHCLSYTESLPGTTGTFIGALDADMIPDPQWLRALLPHMLRNSKLALAQPPQVSASLSLKASASAPASVDILTHLAQRFYDVPTNDPLLQGLDVNYKITEPLKEMMSSTWCGGSGYILRRSAIEDIGGFPTESVGEDMYCSNILLGRGWEAIHVDETLQSGRVPESYKAHVKQQGRWHVGRLQTAIAMRFYLYGDNARLMGICQRIVGLVYVLLSLCHILTAVGLATMLIALSTGKELVLYNTTTEIRRLEQMIGACLIADWVDDCIVALITGYRIAISEGHFNCWIAPYHAATMIEAFTPRWLRNKTFEFTASGSSSERNRKPLRDLNIGIFHRVWKILWRENVGFHLIYVLLVAAALARSCSVIMQHPHESLAMDVVNRLAWPPVLWLVCLTSFAVPIRCAFSPPFIPNRAQLLKRDPVRRASYPHVVQDVGDDGMLNSQTVCYSLIMLYVLGLFIRSFYSWQ